MDQRTRSVMLAVVALSAAAVSVYFSLANRAPKIDLGPYDVLGIVTAEETAKLAGNKGEVLVMVPDTGPNKNPSTEAELKAFEQTLRKHNGLTLATEKVPVTAMLMLATGGGVPPGQFFKALDAHPKVAAVVLFFRFPQLAQGDIERLRNMRIKTVVVSSFYPEYQRLLEGQAIQLAIFPRLDAPAPGAPTGRSVRERFEREFSMRGAGRI